ncbi:MAG: T9SS type A sorting domain-containing protein [Bacteroidales bacterium]|nr:T9SS type A sorting domain-containing protein [Bacteroidales bacterium]
MLYNIHEKFILFWILIILTSSYSTAQTWKTYPYTPAGSIISFPADEGWHPDEPVEWWYISGHLIGEVTNNHYSFMISYFHSPKSGFDGFRIFNLSNDDTGQFFTDVMPVNYNILANDSLNIQAQIFLGDIETWTNKVDSNGQNIPFEYVLSAKSKDYDLNMEVISLKQPLIIADSGFLYQGEGSYTYYYSQTRNTVEGTITFDNTTETVTGISWIDRQYGSFNPSDGENYEWFCVQLSNGMDLNIYNLFTNNNETPDNLRYKMMAVFKDSLNQFTTYNYKIERLAFHYMPDSLRCYSQKWKLTSPDENIDLIITTLHNNSEVLLPFRFYEGTTTITGTVNGIAVTGEGFSELLHSYEKPDIALTNPSEGYWDFSTAVTWQLNNPDNGRPLKYDIAYSIDQKLSFTTIQQALADTFFFWNDPPVSAGDSCWLKITAYSIDTTLLSYITSPKISITTSVNGPAAGNELILLYPNPTNQILTIELKKKYTQLNYQIIDIKGQLIFQKQAITDNKIVVDVSSLKPGVYYLRISNSGLEMVRGFVVR